jgi:hypothetical protein
MTARAYRPAPTSSTPVLQLVLMLAAAVTAVSGLWLWFFSEPSALQGAIGRGVEIAEPFTLHLWVKRLHVVATVVVALSAVAILVRAVVSRAHWELVFLVTLGILLGLGYWSAFAVDWHEVGLWRLTLGTKFDAFSPLADAPSLDGQLPRFRIHVVFVPALMTVLGIAALTAHRRPTR